MKKVFLWDILPLFNRTMYPLLLGQFIPFMEHFYPMLLGHFTPFYWDIFPFYFGQKMKVCNSLLFSTWGKKEDKILH